MKAKRLAAVHAAVFNTIVMTLSLLLFPVAAFSMEGVVIGLEKADLLTPKEFLEYASVNDIDIHELYFGTILYEGTDSCLLCHEKEGAAVLDMGHFKWEGKTDAVAGLEGLVVGKNNIIISHHLFGSMLTAIFR